MNISIIHRGIPQPNEIPHYCILGYGPVIDRDILILTEEQNKKDYSHFLIMYYTMLLLRIVMVIDLIQGLILSSFYSRCMVEIGTRI